MDAIQKSLDQLAKRAPALHANSHSAKAALTSPSVHDSIDRLIADLETARASLHDRDAPPNPAVLAAELSKSVQTTQSSISDRQKEFYAALSKAFKALDRKFPSQLDAVADPSLFTSPEAQHALETVLLHHLLRHGDWQGAQVFSEESTLPISATVADTFTELHLILDAISRGDLRPAIRWAERERDFLIKRQSPLEFALHRSQFIRIATGSCLHLDHLAGSSGGGAESDPDGETTPPSNISTALEYGRRNLQPFLDRHLPEVQRMFTLLAFLPNFAIASSYGPDGSDSVPVEHLLPTVPAVYRPLLDAKLVHAPFLEPLFRLEFSSRNRVSKEAPLATCVEVGAGGALSQIIKVKTIMRERKNEWSQADELPIEIPLPPQLRFHSVFACPVSKEQATEDNPPMMLVCGHVFCRETITKMAKGGGRFKCSYCPTESTLSQAVRVHF